MYGAMSPGFKYRPRLKLWQDGKNNYFNPETFEAVSYNWWTYVTKIKGKVVFNAYPYSPTTQNHQSEMRKLLKHLQIKIDVTVSMRESLGSFHSEALEGLYRALFTVEVEGKTARKPGVYVETQRQWYASRAEAVKALKDSIRTCRQLGAKFSRAEIKAVKKEVERQNESRLERARKQRTEAAELRKKLKPQVNDLGPLSMEVFERASDLESIDLSELIETDNEIENELD